MQSNKRDYVENVFYEHESLELVMFERKSDNTFIFIPKSAIEGGWLEDREKAQNIKLKFEMELSWRPIN